jgi:ketosteroid isomerase-like protein
MKALRILSASILVAVSLAGFARAESPEVAVLLQLERDFTQAWVKGDAKWIAEHEAADLIMTGPDGVLSNKADDLASLKAGTSKVESMSVDDMRVLVLGDTAVVVGRLTTKGKYLGKDMSGVSRFTDTFVKRDGRWQVVASQNTRIDKK